VYSQGDRALITGGGFFYSEQRATGQSARFLNDLTAGVAGSEEESGEQPSESVARRYQRSRAETVPEVASVKARAHARREGGREFQAAGPDAQNDRSPTVFILKVLAAKVGLPDDLRDCTGVQSLSSSAQYEGAIPMRALNVMVKMFSSMRFSMGNQGSSFKRGETWHDRLAW